MGFEPHGLDLSLEARIFGLEARILASNLGFGPQGRDLGLKALIWASRLRFGLKGIDLGLKAGI